jgi:hypothetical protein
MSFISSAASNLAVAVSAIQPTSNAFEDRDALAAFRAWSRSSAELPLFMSSSELVALEEDAPFSVLAPREEKRLVRLEFVPVSQSRGLAVFSDVSPFAPCVGGDAEVVTGADLAADGADERKYLCNCLL